MTVNDAAETAFLHRKEKYDMPMPSPLEKSSTATVFESVISMAWYKRWK